MWTVVAERERIPAGAVELVDLPGEQAGQALRAGTVDAILTWEPVAMEAREAVGGTELWDTAAVPGISWGVYAARRETVEQRRAELQALVTVWQRTISFIREHPDEAFAIVAAVNGRTASDSREFTRLNRMLEPRECLNAFSFAPGFGSVHGSARRMNDFLLEAGLTTRRLDTTLLFDPSFVRGLDFGAAER